MLEALQSKLLRGLTCLNSQLHKFMSSITETTIQFICWSKRKFSTSVQSPCGSSNLPSIPDNIMTWVLTSISHEKINIVAWFVRLHGNDESSMLLVNWRKLEVQGFFLLFLICGSMWVYMGLRDWFLGSKCAWEREREVYKTETAIVLKKEVRLVVHPTICTLLSIIWRTN